MHAAPMLAAREQLPVSSDRLCMRGAAAGLAGAAGGEQRRGGERAARAAAGPGTPGAEGKQAYVLIVCARLKQVSDGQRLLHCLKQSVPCTLWRSVQNV